MSTTEFWIHNNWVIKINEDYEKYYSIKIDTLTMFPFYKTFIFSVFSWVIVIHININTMFFGYVICELCSYQHRIYILTVLRKKGFKKDSVN